MTLGEILHFSEVCPVSFCVRDLAESVDSETPIMSDHASDFSDRTIQLLNAGRLLVNYRTFRTGSFSIIRQPMLSDYAVIGRNSLPQQFQKLL
jgi:hypothetical protein